MFARTSNIFITRKVAKVTKTLAALGVLLFSACTSDKVLEEIPEIDLNGTDPLKFTTMAVDNEAQQNTRANRQPSLTTGFMVSTYKGFLQPNQQTVMTNYNVEYKTTGTAWDGNVRPYWDYTQVPGQYEKYWDYSAFPYRFHAIAPCPDDATGYILGDKQLKINAPYYYQTCHNGLVQTRQADGTVTDAPAEPHILAQVQRNQDGTDQDLLARDPEKVDLNNDGAHTLNREVWMPFHHLNSKIRFAVYSLNPWVTANYLYIQKLSINVTSSQFVTAANTYQAMLSTDTDTDNWRPDTGTTGFTGLTYKNPSEHAAPLFQFDGGKDVPGNDLRECQNQKTAFWMQCPESGMMQLPQENVQMSVTFKLMNDNGVYKKFTDVPVAIEHPDGTYQLLHAWQPGYIYTYYLIIGGTEGLEIQFTCTLTPWEDVTGSLSTDLEQ